MTLSHSETPNGRTVGSVVCIGALLVVFAVMSFLAVRTKSATADEPLHAVAAFARVYENDFRLDVEDPPLFGYWAMIPQSRRSLLIDKTNPAWDETLGYMWKQWSVVTPAMYQTDGIDPDAFLNRSRAMMVALGVALGAVVAWWAWSLGGPFAGVVATALYCFCPNFLGHAPLVKNDVPLALVMCGLTFAAFRAGERMTLPGIVALAMLVATAVTVKFSGLLLVPMLGLMLLARVALRRPWLVLGRIIVGMPRQLGVVVLVLAFCGITSFAVIWVCYGSRYTPTPDPELTLNMPLIAKAAARNTVLNANGGLEPAPGEVERAEASPGLVVRTILALDARRALPQAWLAGLLDTYATTLRRPGYLMGEYGATGWWYYFPLAILFKTPLGTLAACAFGWMFAVWRRVRRDDLHQLDRWAFASFVVPIAFYGVSALATNLNLGLRHVLPLYPLAFVLVGATLASARQVLPRVGMIVVVGLVGATMVETVARFPNYVAFFNFAAGGPRGGLRLLGDSNLDWGQDLKLLARWQKENPDVPLHLSYFGGADPGRYVSYRPLTNAGATAATEQIAPESDATDATASGPSTTGPFTTGPFTTGTATIEPQRIERQGIERGVLAVSATNLQGVYLTDAARPFFFELAKRQPREVLGGTIYLYDYPLSALPPR